MHSPWVTRVLGGRELPPPATSPEDLVDASRDPAWSPWVLRRERVVALRAAEALGLEVCGVDVLVTADGPVVVDVNAWPGAKGVPGAAQRLSAHLLTRLGATEVLACASSS